MTVHHPKGRINLALTNNKGDLRIFTLHLVPSLPPTCLSYNGVNTLNYWMAKNPPKLRKQAMEILRKEIQNSHVPVILAGKVGCLLYC